MQRTLAMDDAKLELSGEVIGHNGGITKGKVARNEPHWILFVNCACMTGIA